MAHRRGRIARPEILSIFELYGKLPLRTDTSLGIDMAWRLCSFAGENGLSAYDSAYLELAQRLEVGLATFDDRLRSVAQKVGIEVLGCE